MEATREQDLQAIPPPCDVILFVTTQTEQQQLEKIAGEEGVGFSAKSSRIGEYFDLGQVGPNRVLAVKTRMGSLRFQGAAWQAISFRSATSATALIATGMAFGVQPQNQKIGDVLVSTHILPYDERKKVTREGSVFTDYARATRRCCKKSLLQTMERQFQRSKNGFEVHFGAFLSGGAQIQSSLYRDQLVRAFIDRGQVVGGDMEGVALASACTPEEPAWILVKGISDFADEERDAVIAEARETACANAIRFVLQALREGQQLPRSKA